MDFKEILFQAKAGDEEAVKQIVEMYQPFIIKNALVNGIFDYDLYQDLMIELLKCIRFFNVME